MEQFKLSQESINVMARAAVMKTLPLLVVAMIAGIVINLFSDNQQDTGGINVMVIFIPFLGILLFFAVRKNVKRQKQLLESYALTIDEHVIIREQLDMPNIRIGRNSVKEIIKTQTGSFIVRGNSSDIIIIPAQLERINQLEVLLNNFVPIRDQPEKTLMQKYVVLVPFLAIALMGAVYISNNKLIVGISGALLVMLMGYSFIKVRQNKNIDDKVKKAIWWLLLVGASVIGVMYFKLIGLE